MASSVSTSERTVIHCCISLLELFIRLLRVFVVVERAVVRLDVRVERWDNRMGVEGVWEREVRMVKRGVGVGLVCC